MVFPAARPTRAHSLAVNPVAESFYAAISFLARNELPEYYLLLAAAYFGATSMLVGV